MPFLPFPPPTPGIYCTFITRNIFDIILDKQNYKNEKERKKRKEKIPEGRIER